MINIALFWTDVTTTIAQIPEPDRFGVPGNLYLINFLFVLTFALHFIFMNLTFGGVFINGLSQLIGKDENSTFYKLKKYLPSINGVTLTFTITLGIAPLLFIQVIYGHFFYTATVLMAYIYVTFFVALVIPYIFLYAQKLLYKYIPENLRSKLMTLFATIALLVLSYVMLIFVSVTMSILHPEQWFHIHKTMMGWGMIVSDPSFWFRYIFMFSTGLIGGGIVISLIGWFKSLKNGDEIFSKFQILGGKFIISFTIMQIIFGILTYINISPIVKSRFTIYPKIGLYITIAMITLLVISSILQIISKKRVFTIITTLLYSLEIIGFAIFRDGLRLSYLKPYFQPFKEGTLNQTSSYGSLPLFFIVFVIGLIFVGYLLKIALTMKPAPKEIEDPLAKV